MSHNNVRRLDTAQPLSRTLIGLLSALDTEPAMLSRERVVAVTSVSMRTVDRAIASGSLHSVQLGRRRLIPREALRAWLAAGLR